MRVFGIIVILLTVFSGLLLFKIWTRPSTSPRGRPPALEGTRKEAVETPRVSEKEPAEPLRTLLDRLVEVMDFEKTRHALLAGFSGRGLYYQRGEEPPRLLDRGVEVGRPVDLAVDDQGRAHAAYFDRSSGEVRYADAGRQPRAWTGLRKLELPGPIRLSVHPEGVLVSYYDEKTETLYYSYRDVRRESWRHGVAHQGGGYSVVTGRPGALVLSD
jgi:hypothetical protein